ncbi:MAG: ATP12 family protein [Alteraurantiacibacter sp.]
MKRFWQEVSVAPVESGWQVLLDGRKVKTQAGKAQAVPTPALAELLAAEWRAQGPEIDPAGFPLRDLTDYAIDVIALDPAPLVAKLIGYAETDTLCYRADPDELHYPRQRDLWEPLVTAAEARHGVKFTRVSGVMHRPQKPETLAALAEVIARFDPFTLAALELATSLSASLITGLAALGPDADPAALFAAANAEEDWQAEQWGWEWTAEDRRALRLAAFTRAVAFVRAANG